MSRRTASIRVRLSPEALAELDSRIPAGQSRSSYVRRLIRLDARRHQLLG